MSDNSYPMTLRSPYKVTSCQLIAAVLTSSYFPKKSSSAPLEKSKASHTALKDSAKTLETPVKNRRKSTRASMDVAESWDPEYRLSNDQYEETLCLSYAPALSPWSKNGPFAQSIIVSKGPIEARVEKFTGIQKGLFQPKQAVFSSPKIVKAQLNIDSIKDNSGNKKYGRYSEPAKSSSELPNVLNKIYNANAFQRRVSTSILLDNCYAKSVASPQCTAPLREHKLDIVSPFPKVVLLGLKAPVRNKPCSNVEAIGIKKGVSSACDIRNELYNSVVKPK